MILSEVGIGVTKEQLTNMFEYATAKPLDVLLVHLDKPVTRCARKSYRLT